MTSETKKTNKKIVRSRGTTTQNRHSFALLQSLQRQKVKVISKHGKEGEKPVPHTHSKRYPQQPCGFWVYVRESKMRQLQSQISSWIESEREREKRKKAKKKETHLMQIHNPAIVVISRVLYAWYGCWMMVCGRILSSERKLQALQCFVQCA